MFSRLLYNAIILATVFAAICCYLGDGIKVSNSQVDCGRVSGWKLEEQCHRNPRNLGGFWFLCHQIGHTAESWVRPQNKFASLSRSFQRYRHILKSFYLGQKYTYLIHFSYLHYWLISVLLGIYNIKLSHVQKKLDYHCYCNLSL